MHPQPFPSGDCGPGHSCHVRTQGTAHRARNTNPHALPRPSCSLGPVQACHRQQAGRTARTTDLQPPPPMLVSSPKPTSSLPARCPPGRPDTDTSPHARLSGTSRTCHDPEQTPSQLIPHEDPGPQGHQQCQQGMAGASCSAHLVPCGHPTHPWQVLPFHAITIQPSSPSPSPPSQS